LGILGNEKADRRAAFESSLGITASSPYTSTEEGIRLKSRERGREERRAQGFGLRRSDWGRWAMSAYA